MPYSLPVYEEKPYNRCIDCVHIGVTCDGPDFLAMEIPRLCEWSRLRKDYLHRKDSKWTNDYIADKSGISKTTVARFFSGNLADLNFSTASQIIRVLVNGTWGQYPCALAAATEQDHADNPAIAEQCRRLQAALDSITAEHRAEIATIRAEGQAKVDYLKSEIGRRDKLLDERSDVLKRKDRTLLWIGIALALSLVLIFGALIVDKLNPHIGFFWVH